MTGTLDLVQRAYTGLAIEEDVLRFEPTLPDDVAELTFPLHYRGHQLRVHVDHTSLSVSAAPADLPAVQIGFDGRREALRAGETLTFAVES
jgi:trehalose/maltose hydrolase-like predicted phosphorylase